MRALLVAALLCALSLPAGAQNAITQEGTTVKDAPIMLKGNNRARQGAGVAGAPSGQIITTGDAVVGGRCDYSAPTDSPDGYSYVCLDAKNSAIRAGGTGLPKGLTIEVDGTRYTVPASAAIVGSDAVVGSNTALKAATGAVGKRLVRLGFTSPGDGGAASYNWSDTNCTAADDGAQVQPTGVTGCWIADFDAVRANVRQWGAKGDCIADDGPAFQKAAESGRQIFIPNGHYLVSTSIVRAGSAFFQGEGWHENGLHYGEHCNLTHQGSYIIQTNATVSLFTVGGGDSAGSSFDNFAVFQLHPAPAASWSPTVYPPVWELTDTYGAVNFSRIGLAGVYKAINATGVIGRLNLSKISGQVFSYLLRTTNAADTSRATDIHIWPFWSADTNVLSWQAVNSDIFYFLRQDGFQADNILAFAVQSCVRIGESADNLYTATGLQFGNLFCDYAKHSVLIDNNAASPTIAISHLWHSGGDLTGTPIPGSNAIQINGQSAFVKIDDLNVLMTQESVVNQTNTVAGSQVNIGTISASGFSARGWNYGASGAYSGTFPVIRDASPATASSTYSILHPIFPQNAGANADAGFSSGVINSNANANLFMATEDQSWKMFNMTTGSTYVWPNWAQTLFLNAAAPIASVTVRLPKSPLDGKALSLTCDNAVTTLTITPDTGSAFALSNPPTSCTAGQSFLFKANFAGQPSWRTLK